MRFAWVATCMWFALATMVSKLPAKEAIRLATSPALSPDGATLAFAWRGDIWLVSSSGGVARPWNTHPGRDTQPRFSPDGTLIAFTSDRTGTQQVYIGDVSGGFATQVSFHSEGTSVEDWFPDGRSLAVLGVRDQSFAGQRLFRVNATQRAGEELLFDAAANDAVISPDGRKTLFTREGVAWWRKGYRGSKAGQIWLCDSATGKFTRLVSQDSGGRSPLWQPDGKGFYYAGGQSGSFNLWQRDLTTGKERRLTDFGDDSVLMPCISRDGATIVFRYLFDFYRYRPSSGEPPRRLDIYCDSDVAPEPVARRTLETATEVSFSSDGLELAMIAGGDLWVMDTELREPRQITSSPEEERSPAYAPDGTSILFVSDMGGKTEIWRATRADSRKYWWLNDRFVLQPLTHDSENKSDLQWSPTGEKVAFVKGLGDLWIMDPDGQNARCLARHWDHPTYQWSPDGKWLTYAVYDDDFNRNVWVVPVDGSQPPVNLSCHPSIDNNPAWSPDGRIIAFTERRDGAAVDIDFIYLQKAVAEADDHDRAVQRAAESLRKARLVRTKSSSAAKAGSQAAQTGRPGAGNAGSGPATASSKVPRPAKPPPKSWIDFDHIADRIHKVSIPDVTEGPLCWSPDSTKLALTAAPQGKAGVYTIAPPDDLAPKLLSTRIGTSARWLSLNNRIVWLASGIPGSVIPGKGEALYRFSVPQEVDVARKYAAAFDICWRAMRDGYYDPRLNNRNWDAVRRKYAPMAQAAASADDLATVVRMMLGELNSSHQGFSVTESDSQSADSQSSANPGHPWKETTAHLGLRFERSYQGPGCKVHDVIVGSPADHVKTKVLPGEIVLSINGKAIHPGLDLTQFLNGPPQRDVHLRVRNAKGAEREMQLRAITYEKARSLLYDQWVQDTEQKVATVSGYRLGYLRIRSMDMASFYHFEDDLYLVGLHKDGLIIDVRDNGGGFTTDRLLTALTQPVHAITVTRGGQPGYPQDRKVYATWNKPIVVLCNQNSFSDAEIFAHAVKTLHRGLIVGVPTAGGVLGTTSVPIMDIGRLRMPYRGWFLLGNGEDMELNGAVPDYVIWPQPDEMSQGKDEQLAKAIEVLQSEVEKWSRRPRPTLQWASQRRRP
jgi:tricorn protease